MTDTDTDTTGRLHRRTAPDGTPFRDLNGNGVLDPYEDPRLTAEERTADLLSRLSLAEKAGLLFQTVIEMGPNGELLEDVGVFAKSATRTAVVDKGLSAFNIHAIPSSRAAARWNNRIQALAEQTPHGIPVTLSTDPRHSFTENSGVAFTSGPFSQWPDMLGLAALGDLALITRFSEIVRTEYRAVGLRMALHPQVDLATEARWGRQLQTFGSDVERVRAYTRAYVEGFQGPRLGPDSVATTTKHFPGGGAQLDGEDPHFPYGREQVYPGGNFEAHLAPFRDAIAAGTTAIMPYYGMPVGLVLDGEPIEEVGFAYNRQILTGLLREQLGFDGVIVSDWELITDNHVGDKLLPARAWGVEELTPLERMVKLLHAGVDQFGGEECVELLIEAVERGLVAEDRIDASARRILRTKFELGLFDDPYVDETAAEKIVGNEEFRRLGLLAQARSQVVLTNDGVLPFAGDGSRPRLYVEGVASDVVARYGEQVASPDDADLALVRIPAPYEPRDDLLLESGFRQGSLEFRPGLVARLARIAETCPLVLVVDMDRPGILTPFTAFARAIVACFGVSDAALLAGLSGQVVPAGRLPVDIPRSMDSVRQAFPDVPGEPADALFPRGHGLQDFGRGNAEKTIPAAWS
ncbi:glycoside hydrolase family 3 protein [Microbacterium nymphoidis]|uniref:glycoside hydrolase family 3 protein n=1 Tax=Microbacterium nymphoidis TaxID=2898586 RepID=UPI001E293943|nr:glycoside hydrolase family 3 N-terminal domain-containing protein [Microbacterium nymphoidis]MCD2498177.1 glycoside hydrolase family 3 protein [Microbacterium nymphoidis]